MSTITDLYSQHKRSCTDCSWGLRCRESRELLDMVRDESRRPRTFYSVFTPEPEPERVVVVERRYRTYRREPRTSEIESILFLGAMFGTAIAGLVEWFGERPKKPKIVIPW